MFLSVVWEPILRRPPGQVPVPGLSWPQTNQFRMICLSSPGIESYEAHPQELIVSLHAGLPTFYLQKSLAV